jgi:predicted esterase
LKIRLLALLTSLIATVALAAPAPAPGTLKEFNVELPTALREIAGRGKLSPVSHALITIAMPANIDMAHERLVLVISATSDRPYHSSRQLLRFYAETAVTSGWILVAADPAESVTVEQDDVPLRLALNTAALAVVGRQWPGADKAPLAFGGFSGGSKYSGWLAAAFASQGRTIIGIYLAGINQDTLVAAATQFNVLNAAFKRVPVFLQAGEKDEVATPANHQDVASDLMRAGFKNVRIGQFPGAHEIDPGPMRAALEWFREFAALPATAR